MAMKSFAPVLLVALALFALATPSTAARKMLTDSCDEHCKMNKALLSAHVRANFLSCAAHGVPLDKSYCGPKDGAVSGCKLAPLSVSAKAYAESLLLDVQVEIKALRAVLDVNVEVLPAIQIDVFIAKTLSAAINVDVSTFNCYAGDKEFFVSAFILADLHVNILVSLKYLLTVQAYIDVVLQVLPTCQNNLSLIQAQVSLFANIVICAGLTVQAVINLCIKYLDCGLCSVLGISLQVILGPILGLVNLLLGVNLTALLTVFLKLCAILKVCILL